MPHSARLRNTYAAGTHQLASLALAFGLTGSIAQAGESVIADFEDPKSVQNWISVNDGVMGGVSVGQFDLTDRDTLLFSGILSLANNGGFASIRTQPRTMDLSGMTAVAVKVRGDGRTYGLDLRGARQRGATSYRASLPTTAGEWTETIIPLTDFTFQSYGRSVQADPIDPSMISSVGFMLADKMPGPFRLEVEFMKAISDHAPVVPASTGNTIVDVAAAAGTFQTLLAAATAADLAGALSSEGPFTVFAPSDDAFARLPPGTVEELLKPENKKALGAILQYHVIAGRVPLVRALELGQGTTLQGDTVPIIFTDGRVKVGPATLVQADVDASNGVIHIIDQVLMPPEASRAPLATAALIELAIERGVPLFNHGSPGACAAVYEITCEALRTMPGLGEPSIKDLERALNEVRTSESHQEDAWTLRRALDRVYARLTAEP